MKKCCIVVGHCESAQGAENEFSQLSEWQINRLLAYEVSKLVNGVEVVVLERDEPNNYRDLPKKINQEGCDFGLSLHCNAYDCTVAGGEVLYYHKSNKGKQLADRLQHNTNRVLKNRDRGIKATASGMRGAHVLRATAMPWVIAEPFFIDNLEEILNALGNWKKLAQSIADTIEEYAMIV